MKNSVTNLYMDMEFTGLHQKTTPISLALVSDNSEVYFYAEFNDYSENQINDWVKENVIPNLKYKDEYEIVEYEIVNAKNSNGNILNSFQSLEIKSNKFFIASQLQLWLKQFDEIVIVGDCLYYDWVLFCDLFGGATKIPHNIHHIPIDIAIMMIDRGIDPDTNREKFAEINEMKILKNLKHNAEWDAHIIKGCYHKLKGMKING